MSFSSNLDDLVSANSNGLLAAHPSWGRVRLSEVAAILNGAPFDSERFSKDRGAPLLRIRDVTTSTTDARYDGDYDPAYWVEPGDLVVGMDGDFKCALWRGPRALLNQRVCKLTPDGRFYLQRFLVLVLPGYLTTINDHTSSITVKHLSSRTVCDISLPLPPLAEQRRIVEALETHFTRLDAAVATLERVRANLKRYRAAVLHAAVEGRLAPAASGSTWNRRRLADLGACVTGTTPPTADSGNYGGVLPFFKPTDLDAGYQVRHARQTLSTRGVLAARPLPSGAVLVTCIGATIGKTGFARVDCATNQQINAFVPTTSAGDPRWFYWCLASPLGQRQIHENASATTLPILNKGRFEELTFPVPPLDEQRRIVDEIERVFSLVDAAETLVMTSESRIARVRHSLLRTAFGGRLVPQDPHDEPASVLLERIRTERAIESTIPKKKPARSRQ